MNPEIDPFRNRHKFQDDVWRQIKLNDLERDVIDTPEFQRLFRTSQLGFVDLAYQTANHTRGAHSIGACHVANLLVDRLSENTAERYDADDEKARQLYAGFTISSVERILIRLGALLHDISHVPLSHDLERKTHRIYYDAERKNDEPLKLRSWYGHYDKHDDYAKNPLLYILTCDTRSSVLARVLQRYSDPFYDELLKSAGQPGRKYLRDFATKVHQHEEDNDWAARRHLLPQLLFHLLTYEKAEEARTAVRRILTSFDTQQLETWHLGPKSLSPDEREQWHHLWYQPFRHDIIGNTLSADLIDYLTRDPQRLATKRHIDLHLLNYYVLVHFDDDERGRPRRFRCAIDLYDYKRGTTRTFLLNDLFRLLDLRQEIHEKAVMHRVVQAANAMLSRGLLLLNRAGRRPLQRELVAFGTRHHALQSEDLFLHDLLNRCAPSGSETDAAHLHLDAARRIFEKIVERRVYRPLMIIPGDRAVLRLQLPRGDSEDENEFPLRTFAALIDSAYYSPFLLFACWCVEKYLEGVFDSANELVSYAEQNISTERASSEDAARALELVPSRVLTWTSPYKQLYKDPAVVVSLDGCIGQIDQIYKNTFPGQLAERSTRERIRNAIADADTKYATLWRLYVFISDGLFYSGILNKLLDTLETANRENHLVRLENAQALLTVAFEAMCNDWTTLNSALPKTADKQVRLEKRMDVEAFKPLVGKWLADYRNETSKGVNRAKGLSTVDVSNYIHGYTVGKRVNHMESARCRDSRYKFDVSAAEAWNAATDEPLAEEYPLIAFLERCGINNPDLLSQREFEELVELYADERVSENCRHWLAEGSVPSALKALWMSEFPTAVAPHAQVFPRDEDSIREWLVGHGEKLKGKRVTFRHWSRTAEQITAFIIKRDRKLWPDIFNDLQSRISNESALFWNNTKGQQILNLLNQKWPLDAA